jgi:hypothetical protein
MISGEPDLRRRPRIVEPPKGAEDAELNLIDRACPKCSFSQPRRLPRTTLLERRVMPWLGFYPWECPLCRIHFFRKNRKDREERISTERATEFGSNEFASQEFPQ